MPGPFTHLMICQAAKNLDEFLGEELWKFLNKYYQFLFLGAESPDLPYLSIGVGGKDWADAMHYDRTNSQVISGFADLRQAWPLRTPADEIECAWFLGYVSHMVADATVHPIVQAIVGPYEGHEEAHRLCEMTMDSLIFDEIIQADLTYAEFSDALKFCNESDHFPELLDLGGFGVLDGGQVYMRTGGFTLGIAGGGLPEPIHSAIDLSHKKGAFFTNFAWGGDVFTRSDITLAYGEQIYRGKFDRDFMYTQGYIRPAETVSLYHSAEFDLHDLQGGTRISRFHLSNGFVTLTYMPLQWLNFNAGYDATRPIFLFESMKNVPDSLFSRQMQEGIRGGISVRLPMNLLVMSNVSYRPTPSQRAQTISSSLRMGNIVSSGIDGGLQFTTTKGIYTTGTDFGLDFSRWFWQSMGITARIDRYAYTISGTGQRLRTTTGSLGLNAMLSRSVYAMLNYDQVWDSLRNTQRVYFECGIRI